MDAKDTPARLTADDLAKIVRGAWNGDAAPQADDDADATVFVVLRAAGRRLSAEWATGAGAEAALAAALKFARGTLTADDRPDHVELCLVERREPVAWRDRGKTFSFLRRGIVGAEITYGDDVSRVAPTEIIASNRKYSRAIQAVVDRHGLSDVQAAERIDLACLHMRQFFIPLAPEGQAVEMFRGNQTVRPEDITRDSVAGLAERMSGWMFNNLMSSGRMIYKYMPSQGKEAVPANNTIRQWMATVCLVRIARFYGDADRADRAERNIAYNLAEFYRMRDGHASIELNGSSKLGAIALAALALSESPKAAEHRAEEDALAATIRHLWAPDGSFRTFLWPAERNDNHNFYPGEALLYLAHKHRETGDAEIAAMIRQSFAYYRSWHLENRNPAFVPWHSMAYGLFLDTVPDPEMAEWVFEMNDWLLSMQQTAPDGFPDIDGRFYDPARPHFGVPHASSTGVYLEGLVSALQLARRLGDTSRAEAYRRAILRGLRSLMQLEFRSEAEMFYITNRKRVQGGLRTTVYNNIIRMDNVQHGLMAILRILDAFAPEDYSLD